MEWDILRAAVELNMQTEVCRICHRPTLYVLNEHKNNVPSNCGQMMCMKADKDPLAKKRGWKDGE